MKIRLDLIKPSPRPVRSSWDEGKMEELTQSIKEQGLIVPIKVRLVSEFQDVLCPIHDYNYLDSSDERGYLMERFGGSWHPEDCRECKSMMAWIWGPEEKDKDGYDISPFEKAFDEDLGYSPLQLPFEIVYGHRRVEACRRAGFVEIDAWIDAWIEGTDDFKAFLEAGIENVQVEDMPVLDKAKWIKAIQEETGWGQMECERQLGIKHNTISRWLAFLEEYEAGAVPNHVDRKGKDQGLKKTLGIKKVFEDEEIDDPILKRKVAEKSIDLTDDQTREVVQTVARAKDDAEREAILETDYADLVRMPQFIQAKAEAKRKTERRETKKRQQEPREVAQYHDALTVFQSAVTEAVAVAEYGKFSPEAARFVKRKHDRLRQSLEELERAFNVTE